MLDLEAVLESMHGLADEVRQSREETLRRRDRGQAQIQAASAMIELRAAVMEFNQEMALPAEQERMSDCFPPPAAGDYTVIATDGSQVAPDYHHVSPWYIINAGCAVMRYGPPPGRARSRLSSHPTLKPPRRVGPGAGEADDPKADARAAAVNPGGRIEVERLRAELELASQLLDEEGDPGRTVLLLDGPLIQWRMISDLRGPEKGEIIRLFKELVWRSRELRIPIAGFISRSRAIEWVTLLRFSLCPDVASFGRLCSACRSGLLRYNMEPPKDAHHEPLAGLRDTELAAGLLDRSQRGWRTSVIELQSKIWNTEITEGAGAAGFFYLQTGAEIARVEVPQWVWEDEEQMKLLHGAVWDQCEVGHGYPMALSEAHEAAVVRAPERDAFYMVIERILRDHDAGDAAPSAKARSKRRPLA
ncbi:MAG: DNA double-strand break repair nuclease NurA [Actinomycetota bacterium]